MNDFNKQKIVWGNLCLSAQYALVDSDYYINAPSPMIVPGNKYILAVLNSKIGDWYIRNLGVTRNGGYFEYKPMFVEQLPIPEIDESTQDYFNKTIDLLYSEQKKGHNTDRIEHEIDYAIYNLYSLNADEIRFFEDSNKKMLS